MKSVSHLGRVVPAAQRAARSAKGIILLDGLIAILIFSIGILGMVALQGVSVKFSTDAKYRTYAAMHADQLIAQMWGASSLSTTTLVADFSSASGGTAYTTWASAVANDLPGITSSANQPTVTFAGTEVTVTVFWQGPNDIAGPHQYVSISQIAP